MSLKQKHISTSRTDSAVVQGSRPHALNLYLVNACLQIGRLRGISDSGRNQSLPAWLVWKCSTFCVPSASAYATSSESPVLNSGIEKECYDALTWRHLLMPLTTSHLNAVLLSGCSASATTSASMLTVTTTREPYKTSVHITCVHTNDRLMRESCWCMPGR